MPDNEHHLTVETIRTMSLEEFLTHCECVRRWPSGVLADFAL